MIAPMLATPGSLPPTSQDMGWAYEIKWDGMRAVATVAGGTLLLQSRNDRDVTVSFPELAGLASAVGNAVLDGEIVAFNDTRQPDFGRLQRRMHVLSAGEAARLSHSDPVTYLVFDLLALAGEPLLEKTYAERRALLAGLGLQGPHWQTPPHFVGGGAQALRTSQELGLEGIIAKRLDGRYHPGRRSADWLKIKNLRTQEIVVGGWKIGAGRRSGGIGSLLMGVPEHGGLTYVGKVGTGFDDRTLALLHDQLTGMQRPTSPFAGVLPRADTRGAVWTEPTLVGEVSYTEVTGDGRLRHPVWRGVRPDKGPGDVVREG